MENMKVLYGGKEFVARFAVGDTVIRTNTEGKKSYIEVSQIKVLSTTSGVVFDYYYHDIYNRRDDGSFEDTDRSGNTYEKEKPVDRVKRLIGNASVEDVQTFVEWWNKGGVNEWSQD